MEHSPTSATGTGRERTPWHATQRAAWEALTKTSRVSETTAREEASLRRRATPKEFACVPVYLEFQQRFGLTRCEVIPGVTLNKMQNSLRSALDDAI